LPRSRASSSFCTRSSSTCAKNAVKPSAADSSGHSIETWIEGWSNLVSVGPWCSVFHHSTE
jgi:hypothetical protein